MACWCWRTRATPGPARAPVPVPVQGQGKLTAHKAANRVHAQLPGPGERANTQLKTWRIPQTPLLPPKAGQLAKAIHVLQTREIGG